MDVSQYHCKFEQVAPFTFNAEIVTFEGNKFTNMGIRAHPQQINEIFLIEHFLSDRKLQHWTLNIDAEIIPEIAPEEKPAEVIVNQEIKEIEETKGITEPITESKTEEKINE